MRRTTRFVESAPVRQEWCARVLRWLFESPASASCGERFRGRPGLPRNDVAFVSENGNRLSEEFSARSPVGARLCAATFPAFGKCRVDTRRTMRCETRYTSCREHEYSSHRNSREQLAPRPRRPNAAPVVHQLRKLMDRCVCGFWWLHLRFPVTLRTRNSIDLPTASLYL
jgi:hypothetical protein